MSYSSLTRIAILITACWVLIPLITAQVIAPHCSDKCGNISIPYPFGIEEGCYFNENNNKTVSSFKLNCTNQSTSPTPVFGTNLEVLNISLVEGEFRSRIYISYNCYNQSGYVSGWFHWFNLATFTVSSSKNVLVAIGCDTYAWFRGFRSGKNYSTGCMTECVQLEDVVDGECSGIGCCEASIPSGTKNVSVGAYSFSNHSSVYQFNPCSVAFPVAKDAFRFYRKDLIHNVSYYHGMGLPVVFDWAVGRKNCSAARADGNCLCKHNADCYDAEYELGYRCKCKDGYSGNPYLPRGCTDIDECKEVNDCEKAEYCINTIGAYYCKCPKGYHGNGTRTDRCISNTKAYWLIPVLATAGFTLVLIILIPIGWWLCSENKRRQAIKQREKYFERNGGMLLQQQMSSNGSVVDRIRIFPINELEKATDHFNEDRILGHGGHGTVYKGMLPEGRIVAVKKSNILKESERGEFINEVVILSQINHRNILKLLGCCLETEVPLLVYEFIPNGTLFHHIHNPSEDFPITWKMRLQIASDSAGALAYLHSSSSTLIYHRDIKSSNILLDDKYRAKLSDFGTSRAVDVDQTRIVTRVMGTFGYMDPEYFQSHQYTEKSDVYSFGVVLVELLTGQKAVRAASEQDRSLTAWFLSHMENSCVFDILDYQLLHEGSKEELQTIANLAKRCLNLDGKKRPTMKEVLLELDVVLSLHVPQTNGSKKPISAQMSGGITNSSQYTNTSYFENIASDSAELSLYYNPR